MSRLIHKSSAKTEFLLNLKSPMNTSDARCMELTAPLNSRMTHQIDSKNRVMADSGNCENRYVTSDP
jgi:hypothetical protein